jgi:hypothetical protein
MGEEFNTWYFMLPVLLLASFSLGFTVKFYVRKKDGVVKSAVRKTTFRAYRHALSVVSVIIVGALVVKESLAGLIQLGIDSVGEEFPLLYSAVTLLGFLSMIYMATFLLPLLGARIKGFFFTRNVLRGQ